MKILITGANGFVGKNLSASLHTIAEGKDKTKDLTIEEIYEFDIDKSWTDLKLYCQKADFVYHFAGVNRPKESSEFQKGNVQLTEKLLETLIECGNTCPILFSSSVQASLTGRYADSEYGRSKLAGEEILCQYKEKTGAKVLIYRFPNLFGKWCRPNYNSAVATFCYNMANHLPLQVNNRETELELAYIDDVIEELIAALKGKEHNCQYQENRAVPASDGVYAYIPITYHRTLGEITDMLEEFRKQPYTYVLSEIPEGSFQKKLYTTYLSYLPYHKVSFPFHTYTDERGSFTELLKTVNCGQLSLNISKPGYTKGQHWHHSKWEIFIVVSGHALIQERRIGTDEIWEYEVSGEHIKAIYMIPGFTHNIINLSDTEDLITLIWANEIFDKGKPDTFREQV